MVRGIVGRGFGYTVLVTCPHSPFSYDGKPLVTLEISEEVEGSGLSAAWLTRTQLTKPARLFVDFCKEMLAEDA